MPPHRQNLLLCVLYDLGPIGSDKGQAKASSTEGTLW